MFRFYKLVNGEPVQCKLGDEGEYWALKTRVRNKTGAWLVSTIFLKMDHAFPGDDGPIVFETMIFPYHKRTKKTDFLDVYCERYQTMAQAKKGHREAVQSLKKGIIYE